MFVLFHVPLNCPDHPSNHLQQRPQIYHAIATAANNDRGIDAPNQPPSHPIRAPIITTRHLRICENETNACGFCPLVCVAVQDVELAGEPTNHPIVSTRDLHVACHREIYLFKKLGVEFRAIPSIQSSIYSVHDIVKTNR